MIVRGNKKKKDPYELPTKYLREAGIACFQKDAKTIIVIEKPDENLRKSIREFLDKNGFKDIKVLFLYDNW